MNRILLLLCGVCFSVLGLAGCAAAPSFSPESAGVGERSELGQQIEIAVRVRNDNSESLPLRTVNYTLQLDGVAVFTGVRAAEATLGPNDSRVLVLPAFIPATAANSPGPHVYRLTGTLTYLTPGSLAETLYDLNLRVPTESFVVEGEIALP